MHRLQGAREGGTRARRLSTHEDHDISRRLFERYVEPQKELYLAINRGDITGLDLDKFDLSANPTVDALFWAVKFGGKKEIIIALVERGATTSRNHYYQSDAELECWARPYISLFEACMR